MSDASILSRYRALGVPEADDRMVDILPYAIARISEAQETALGGPVGAGSWTSGNSAYAVSREMLMSMFGVARTWEFDFSFSWSGTYIPDPLITFAIAGSGSDIIDVAAGTDYDTKYLPHGRRLFGSVSFSTVADPFNPVAGEYSYSAAISLQATAFNSVNVMDPGGAALAGMSIYDGSGFPRIEYSETSDTFYIFPVMAASALVYITTTDLVSFTLLGHSPSGSQNVDFEPVITFLAGASKAYQINDPAEPLPFADFWTDSLTWSLGVTKTRDFLFPPNA